MKLPKMRGTRRAARQLTLAAVGILFCANLANATPPVVWSPSTVSVTLKPGETATATADLHTLAAIGDVAVRVVPELAGMVTVNPGRITGLQAGASVRLTLTFSAATTARPGMFDGTLQLRATPRKGGQGRVWARPLPLTVTIREDPLVGTDADGDGVWDYIGDYIDQTQPSPEMASALRRLAISLQNAITSADDPPASLDEASRFQRRIECLYHLRSAEARGILNAFMAASLNTLERSRAYVHFSDQLGGQFFPSTPLPQLGSTCNP